MEGVDEWVVEGDVRGAEVVDVEGDAEEEGRQTDIAQPCRRHDINWDLP
jgi:hypothetical protein